MIIPYFMSYVILLSISSLFTQVAILVSIILDG